MGKERIEADMDKTPCVVITHPSSSGKFAILFDAGEEASEYIKQRCNRYINQDTEHPPVETFLSDDYALAKWSDLDFVEWTLVPVLTREASESEP